LPMNFEWRDDPLLMIPGPSELHPRVREVLASRFYPHYGPEWRSIYPEIEEAVKRVFKTRNEVIIMPGPGCLGLELGVVNVANRGDKVVAIVNGFFGERLAEIAGFCGVEVVNVTSPPGYIVPSERLMETLDNNPDAVALVCVHNESATGVLNPIKDYVELAKKRGLFTVVDAVSSFGGVEIDVDGWGIDVCVGYPNKCLSGLPGALPVSISDEVWERVERGLVRPASWLTNLRVWRWYRENWAEMGHPYPTTVNTFSYLALKVAVEAVLEEGLERVYERHARVATALRASLNSIGLRPVPRDEEFASPTITVAHVPQPLHGKVSAIVENMLLKWRIMVSRGLTPGLGDVIRIGHMGVTASPRCVGPTIAALSETMRILGYEDARVGVALEAFYKALDARPS